MRTICLIALLLSSCASTMSVPEPPARLTAESTAAAESASYEPTSQGLDGQRYGTSAGESLLTFGGALSNTTPEGGDSTTSLTAQVGVGRFLSDTKEMGLQALLFKTDDLTVLNLAPYFNFNFRLSSRTWLYAGPHIGVLIFDQETAEEIDIEFSYGVHGGIRRWATPSTSLYIEPRFTTSDLQDEFAVLFGMNISLGQ
jgi:hypothetical protein